MNFPPDQNYRSRSVSRYSAARTATNGRGVDVIMYRITDRAHSDAMINLEARGVPVRPITEQAQYPLSTGCGTPGTSTGCPWPASRSATASMPG